MALLRCGYKHHCVLREEVHHDEYRGCFLFFTSFDLILLTHKTSTNVRFIIVMGLKIPASKQRIFPINFRVACPLGVVRLLEKHTPQVTSWDVDSGPLCQNQPVLKPESPGLALLNLLHELLICLVSCRLFPDFLLELPPRRLIMTSRTLPSASGLSSVEVLRSLTSSPCPSEHQTRTSQRLVLGIHHHNPS